MSPSGRMIIESTFRRGRDEQQRRAVRRRIRETLAVRRAAAAARDAAAGPEGIAEHSMEPPAEPGLAA